MQEVIDGTAKVLVIGAGGLGCEILKDLALSGVRDITVIDLDTIDLSNLNRQFLFRQKDVGRGKAEVAAEFIMSRVPTCKVTPHKKKIQEFDPSFYSQFKVVVSGLDNIEARRWLNSTLYHLVDYDEDGSPLPETIVPLVDGGTEGLKGQARVIVPAITSCFECSIESFPEQKTFQLCTIAETPRIPEHCIAYAYIIEWEKEFPEKKLDKDSPDDMNWVYQRALQRATIHKIEGVTYFKTLGVVKNIIPAVASTNAAISAACVAEVFKLLTYSAQSLNTYLMYMGSQGVYTHTFEYGRKESCLVCGDGGTRKWTVSGDMTLAQFLQSLCDDIQLQLKVPSATSISATGDKKSLFVRGVRSLEEQLKPNLDKPMKELVESGEIVTITDPILEGVALQLQIELQ